MIVDIITADRVGSDRCTIELCSLFNVSYRLMARQDDNTASNQDTTAESFEKKRLILESYKDGNCKG
jgi:hypothetical protein